MRRCAGMLVLAQRTLTALTRPHAHSAQRTGEPLALTLPFGSRHEMRQCCLRIPPSALVGSLIPVRVRLAYGDRHSALWRGLVPFDARTAGMPDERALAVRLPQRRARSGRR